ncbi:MAG: LysM peptidoglycan-binding domain-containing protein [Pseudomonadota bacterium]
MATFTHPQVSATRRRLRLTLAAASIAAVFSLSGCALWETAPADEPIAELPSAEDIAIVVAPTTESDVPRTAALKRNPDEVVLREDAPDTYTVQKHDTLWDIAAHFLEDAYTWPEIWHQNPQIADPHLIFPGDKIGLRMVDGKPVLSIHRGKRGKTILQPRVREAELEQAVPVIAADVLKNFDAKPRVVSKQTLDAAPYVLANTQGRVISAAPDSIYVRGITDESESIYHVLRPNKPLIDPDTNEILGYEALHTGEAQVQYFGDPSTLQLIKTGREVLRGDRLTKYEGDATYRDLKPILVKGNMRGTIISLVDALSKAGQYQVVVFNRGAQDGLQAGSMVELMGRERKMLDKTLNPRTPDRVTLPSQRKGVAIVFQSFDWVSYAMILEAQMPIDLYDSFQGF